MEFRYQKNWIYPTEARRHESGEPLCPTTDYQHCANQKNIQKPNWKPHKYESDTSVIHMDCEKKEIKRRDLTNILLHFSFVTTTLDDILIFNYNIV